MWISKKNLNHLTDQIGTLERKVSALSRVECDLVFDLKRSRADLAFLTDNRYVVGPGGATLYAGGEEFYVAPGDSVESDGNWVFVRSSRGGVMAKLSFTKSFIIKQNKETDQA